MAGADRDSGLQVLTRASISLGNIAIQKPLWAALIAGDFGSTLVKLAPFRDHQRRHGRRAHQVLAMNPEFV